MASAQELLQLQEWYKSKDDIGLLWKLHWFSKIGYEMRDWQEECHFSTSRHRVIIAGRRSGKTFFAGHEASADFASDVKLSRRIWIITPTYQGTEKVFRVFRQDMNVGKLLSDSMVVTKSLNRSPFFIKTVNDGFLEGKSADKPDFRDSLVGEELDLLIVDEACKIRGFRWIWQELLRPTLSDRRGRAIFITTPRGYDYMYELFKTGQDYSRHGEWSSWQISSIPYLDPEEIKEARKDLTPEGFAQEFEAKFTTRAGRVYPLFDDQPPYIFDGDVNIKDYIDCVLGVDRGWVTPTALTVHLKTKDGQWDQIDEVYGPGMTFDDVVATIRSLRSKWPIRRVYYAPEQASEIYQLNKKYRIPTESADRSKEVNTQIDFMRILLKIDPVLGRPADRIHRRCVKTRWEFDRYSWKERRGTEISHKDEVDKVDDHAMDARRYAIYTVCNRPAIRQI